MEVQDGQGPDLFGTATFLEEDDQDLIPLLKESISKSEKAEIRDAGRSDGHDHQEDGSLRH